MSDIKCKFKKNVRVYNFRMAGRERMVKIAREVLRDRESVSLKNEALHQKI